MSVVVPAYNEDEAIEECLDSVCGQDFRSLEVIVVDGMSTDGTAERVRDYATRDHRVRLISNPDRIVPAALNRALREANGEYLVRVDAHAAIPPDYVGRCASLLSSGRWGGVGGRKDGVGRTIQGKAISLAMASPFGVGGSRYHYGQSSQVVDHIPFGAYPVALARSLGGWDERLAVNQDFEFDFRVRDAGHELLFDPSLSIQWECRQSFRDLWKQYFRYGRGKTKVAMIHPASLKIRHVAVPAFAATFLAAVAGSFLFPAALALVTAPYLLFVAVGTLVTGAKTSERRVRPLIGVAFVVMHFSWGLGFIRGIPDAIRTRYSRASEVEHLQHEHVTGLGRV